MIELLKELHNGSLEKLGELKFSKQDEFSRTIVSLYCALIEQTWSLLIIVEQGREAGTSQILRSILEAHVSIVNLLTIPDYIKHLNASHHKEWHRLLTEAAKGENPFLYGLDEVADLAAEIEKHNSRLSELKDEGFPPLLHKQAFTLAGMEDVYRSVYNHLCNVSHNNIRALIERHWQFSGEDDFSLVIYQEHEPADFEAQLDTAAGALVGAGLGIHSHFNSPALSETEAMREKLMAYRRSREET